MRILYEFFCEFMLLVSLCHVWSMKHILFLKENGRKKT
jgi:hypothetical protein